MVRILLFPFLSNEMTWYEIECFCEHRRWLEYTGSASVMASKQTSTCVCMEDEAKLVVEVVEVVEVVHLSLFFC